jgi:5-methylthioadenosine/S-adenosylhomocysteine deaminase
MKLRLTRYCARWVLPVTSPPIRDGAVLVDEDGAIVSVGPQEAVPSPDGAVADDLGEAVLLPGLVNAHAHLDLCMFRGCLEDLAFPDWIARLLELKREAALTAADLRSAARWSCIEALLAGITTLGTTDDGDTSLAALRESGQRGIVFREVFGPAPDQAVPAMDQVREQIDAMREHETDLVRVGISPHAPYSVSPTLFTAAANHARAQSLPLAVHAAESRAEMELVTRGLGVFADRLRARGITTGYSRSPIDLLEKTGVLSLSPLLVHAVHVDAADIALMEQNGAKVVHCPTANARLGHGIAPILELTDAGICVALGTDSVASNNRMDILEEARFAQMLQRARSGSPSVLDGARLLELATLEGARALGFAERAGSLEPGKDADLCALRLNGVHVRPLHDPLAALFHSARAPDVMLTMVRGRPLYRDGRVLTLEADRARAEIEAVGARVRRAALGGRDARTHVLP